jgi:hypothetical protein
LEANPTLSQPGSILYLIEPRPVRLGVGAVVAVEIPTAKADDGIQKRGLAADLGDVRAHGRIGVDVV